MASFTSNDATLHYTVYGEGTPILLLHGACIDFNFNYVSPGWIDTLTKHGYQVIGLDFRGHGRSAKSTDSAFYGLEIFTEDVINLMKHLQLKSAAVMGYSMGTVVALNLLHKHPQYFTKAVLVATGNTLMGKPPFQKVIGVIDQVLAFDTFPSQLPKHIAVYWSFIHQLGLDKAAIRAFSLSSFPSLTEQEIATITTPVLIISGEQDLVLRQGKETAALLPNGSYAEIKDADHFTLATDAHTHEAAIEFLAG